MNLPNKTYEDLLKACVEDSEDMYTHRNKTYRDLLNLLQGFSQEQLDQTVTVWHHESDEFLPVFNFNKTYESCDVFDPGQILLEVL